jgi:hypothetical protein
MVPFYGRSKNKISLSFKDSILQQL